MPEKDKYILSHQDIPRKPFELRSAAGNIISAELIRNRELGIHAAIGHWGEAIAAETMQLRTGIEPQGFKRIWQYPLGTSRKAAEDQEQETAVTVLQTLVQSSGVDLGRVGWFYFANSSPIISSHYGRDLAKKAGLPSQCNIFEENGGCNSGARVTQKHLEATQNQPDLIGQYAIIMGLEGMCRLLTEVNPETVADAYSRSILSNGAAALLIPIGAIKMIAGVTRIQPDIKKHIAARLTYEVNPNDGGILEIGEDQEKVWIPLPDSPTMMMQMDLRGIVIDIPLFVAALLHDLDTKEQERVNAGEVEKKPYEKLIAHHPSYGLMRAFGRKAQIPSEKLRFDLEDGNTSGAAVIEALGLEVPSLRPGVRFRLMGVGGGYFATAMTLEVNSMMV